MILAGYGDHRTIVLEDILENLATTCVLWNIRDLMGCHAVTARVVRVTHGVILDPHSFQNQEYVFSGHFHKRQVKNNIHYLGNAFPHNYADVDDNERGMMVLEWDKEPRYLNWHNCPKYKYVKLSELLDKTKEIMQPKMHLRVTLDIDISYEEASFIKETFMKEYDCREITLIPSKKDEEINSDLDLTKFESVDEIVAKELDSIESDNYNKKTLIMD